jgi:hypothetical protein
VSGVKVKRGYRGISVFRVLGYYNQIIHKKSPNPITGIKVGILLETSPQRMNLLKGGDINSYTIANNPQDIND